MIDETINRICVRKGWKYSAETPSGENVAQDNTSSDDVVVWRNIVEDGIFDTNKQGFSVLKRHLQIGLYQQCRFDERGEVLNKQKDELLNDAFAFYREFAYTIKKENNYDTYQSAMFQCGYDKNDANMTFALIDVFIQENSIIDCL